MVSHPVSNASGIPIESWMRNRAFVSAQRRYENAKVRESTIRHRLCYECGKIVNGDDTLFQHHVVSHEAAYICYQLYHFEKGNILPKGVVGEVRHHQPKAPANGEEVQSFRKPLIARTPMVSPNKSAKKAKKLSVAQGKVVKPKAIIRTPFVVEREPVHEPRLSSESDESDTTVSEDEEVEEEVPLDPDSSDDERSSDAEFEVDQLDEEYRPVVPGTSSRGRARKPKHLG